MTSNVENQKKFPSELHDPLTFWSAQLIELLFIDYCPFSGNTDLEIEMYLANQVTPQLKGLHAQISSKIRPFAGKEVRVFFISFPEEEELIVRQILTAEGITWPLRRYKMTPSLYALNLVQCMKAGAGADSFETPSTLLRPA